MVDDCPRHVTVGGYLEAPITREYERDAVENAEGGGGIGEHRDNFLNRAWSWIIRYVQRKFHERRARREKETPTERAERKTADGL